MWHSKGRLWRLRIGVPGVLGVLLLASLAACTSTTVIPLPSVSATMTTSSLAPCVARTAQGTLRLWARDTILVSLQSSGTNVGAPSTVLPDATNALDAILASAAPPGVTLNVSVTPPNLIAFGATAAAVFKLQQSNTQQECLGLAVDAINSAAAKSASGIALAQTPNIRITGASPDWYVLGAGPDYIGGSPSDPPAAVSRATLTLVSSSASKAPYPTPPVYILDTGYPLQNASCPVTATMCAQLVSDLRDSRYVNVVSDERTTSHSYGDNPFTREHGVFIAAIVRHLAPTVPIQLVRVLNDYGVGDTAELLAGLAQVRAAHTPGAIVNLSLSVEPPLDCLMTSWQYTYSAAGNGTQVYSPGKLPGACAPGAALKVDTAHAYRLKMLLPLGLPIAALVNAGYHLVAAAGNDSRYVQPQHLGADMPAAFCGVTAVAATVAPVGLDWAYRGTPVAGLAAFSNLPVVGADACVKMPDLSGAGLPFEETGVAASGRATKTDGVRLCSLYIHSPEYLSGSTSGLATWSGTSFATAVISGNEALNAALTGAAPALRAGQSLVETLPCSAT